jgi:hypothetical protein
MDDKTFQDGLSGVINEAKEFEKLVERKTEEMRREQAAPEAEAEKPLENKDMGPIEHRDVLGAK